MEQPSEVQQEAGSPASSPPKPVTRGGLPKRQRQRPPQPEPEPEPDTVFFGGLFPCCLDTLWRVYCDGPARFAKEGQRLHCTYHPDQSNHVMIFHEGLWQWDHKYRGPDPLTNGVTEVLTLCA